MKLHKIPKQVHEALEATGLPYEFIMGTRHIQIRLDGHFVGILPKGSSAKSEAYGKGPAMKNSITQIRRAARKLKDMVAA